MSSQGILTIVSGFSGVGKGTLMKCLLSEYPSEYCLSISATTRAPRAGETDGVNYFFVTREQFETMIREDKLIEYARYVDYYYGTPKDFVVEKLSQGINVILEIEMQGALKMKQKYPESLLIFVVPPKASDLEERLVGRGTEPPEVIKNRLRRAAQEAVYMKDYDYIVVNDEVERATRQIHEIITNERDRVLRRDDFIEKLTQELQIYSQQELK